MTTTTVTSRDFNQNKTSVKKAARHGPVIITERGQPAHVLMTYADYEQLAGTGKTIADLLAMPEGANIDIEFPRLPHRLRDVDLG